MIIPGQEATPQPTWIVAFHTSCVKWPVTPPLDELVLKFQFFISLYQSSADWVAQVGSLADIGSLSPAAKMFSPTFAPRFASCAKTHLLAYVSAAVASVLSKLF